MTIDAHTAQGICAMCQKRPLQHGPWTAEQVAEVAADIGCDLAEFQDWCDDCFVAFVGMHDVKHATELAGRRLVLTEPRYVAQQGGVMGLVGLFFGGKA